jgi:hypothetical protein
VLPPFDAPDCLQNVFPPRWRTGSTLVDIGRVELSTGYQGAWTNGLGDYLLSDLPGFDAGRDLGGNWRALRRE